MEHLNLLEQNRLLSQEVKRRIDQMTAINAVASVVGHSLDLDRTLETALRIVIDVVGAEAGGISLLDRETGEVVLRAQQGWEQDFVSEPMRIPISKGMSGEVITGDDVLVDNDLDGTEELAVPGFHRERFRSIAMVPMHARGEIIGILSIMSDHTNRFNEDMTSVLRVIADTVGVALSNARLYENSQEQNNRLQAILQSTADGIIATDQNSRISLVNQAAGEMLRLDSEALVGVPLREAPIPDQMREMVLRAVASRGEHDAHRAFEVTLDEMHVISAAVSPVYVEKQVDQDDAQDGWVIVLQDVSHLRQEELARSEFIQAAAHDMRNPLSVTQSALLMLQREFQNDASADEIIRLALDGVGRLQGLIDDLLQLERIESGYNFNTMEAYIPEVLDEIYHEISPVMTDKTMRFELELPERRLPLVEADLHWLKRAVHNYLSNAAKYTPEGSTIILRAYEENRFVHIEVADNGPGIPPQAIPRLFERFYRVDDGSRVTGTGLGLAIVKSVAEAHGGTVYVRSTPGEGSTFGLTIPAKKPARGDAWRRRPAP